MDVKIQLAWKQENTWETTKEGDMLCLRYGNVKRRKSKYQISLF